MEEVLKALFVQQFPEEQRPLLETFVRYYCAVEQPNLLITGPLQEAVIVYPVEWITPQVLSPIYYTGPLRDVSQRVENSRKLLERAQELGHPPFLTYNVFEHPYARKLLEQTSHDD